VAGGDDGDRGMGKDRRRFLKLAYKNAQREVAWAALGIDRAQLDALYEHVERRRVRHGCDSTLRYTQEWAMAHPEIDWPRLRLGLVEAGGHCDCEVLANTDPDQSL
jgi:hypothetical protein